MWPKDGWGWGPSHLQSSWATLFLYCCDQPSCPAELTATASVLPCGAFPLLPGALAQTVSIVSYSSLSSHELFLCLQLCSAHLALLYTFTLHPNLLYKFYIHYTIHIHYIHYIHYIHVQVCMVLTDCRWIAYSSGVPGLGLCFISYHPLCLCSSTTHPCLHFSRPLKLYQSCLPMLHHYIKAINTSSYTECQLVTISCKKYGCNIQG